ncbi:MFS transporter [Radicibacter daui]|uniref:MFS transporter n=1 Tax=Radicibacter daui TaxID=3064829 RepID=UPI004046B1BD
MSVEAVSGLEGGAIPASGGRGMDTGSLDFERVPRQVILLSGFMVLVAAVLVFALALMGFKRDLVPEIDAQTQAVASAAYSTLDQALQLGIPVSDLVGVNDFFAETINDNPEIDYIAVTGPATSNGAGRVLFGAGKALDQVFRPGTDPISATAGFRDEALALKVNDQLVGTLHAGISENFVTKSMEDIAFDLAIVLLVALLATFELLMFFINRTLSGPMSAVLIALRAAAGGDFSRGIGIRAHDEVGRLIGAIDRRLLELNGRFQKVVAESGSAVAHKLPSFTFAPGVLLTRPMQIITDVRLPLLLYVLAGEMSRSFFPNFVKSVYTPIPGLSYDAALGLPISAFMFVVAAATPAGGSWADRIGGRRLFLISMVPTLIGMLGTGFAQNLYQLIAFWSLNAIGYALATIACQSRIVHSTTAANRAQGMAAFVTAIMVAAICGTSFGGVLADRIGFRATFVVSAVFVLLSGLIVAAVFTRTEDGAVGPRPSLIRALGAVSRNARFIALMAFGAVPAKLILTGFLYYMVPLYLAGLGRSPAEIGRLMMIYFAIMILVGPFFARLADRSGKGARFVVLGGVMAGLGAALLPLTGGALGGQIGALIAVVLLGFGQAFSTAPLIALIPELCAAEAKTTGPTALLGILRVVERVGSVLGPLLAALVVGYAGYEVAAQTIGIIVAVTAVLLGLVLAFWPASRSTGSEILADEAKE